MDGFGVMLCKIFRRGEGEPLRTGKIASLVVSDEALEMRFDDGTGYRFRDDGQSCCESRYMRSDDKPEEYIGAMFVSAQLAEAPSTEGEYGEPHEIQFLRIITDRGTFTCSNHNEHNGYYGGFCIHVDALSPEAPR